MASGVAISDEVLDHYQNIKVRRQGSEERERFKLVVMQISEDQKSIIVDHDASLKNKDIENEKDVFKKVMSMLPKADCRYALYDCSYATKDCPKEDLVFIMWAPEDAPMKKRMIYASSKSALRAKLQGLKFEWQVNDVSDAADESSLLEKLGGRSTVKSLEGKSV